MHIYDDDDRRRLLRNSGSADVFVVSCTAYCIEPEQMQAD
jgi:hypothetical protein